MNNKPVGGNSSETLSHPIDMNNKRLEKNFIMRIFIICTQCQLSLQRVNQEESYGKHV
jgi:hypothetical protein